MTEKSSATLPHLGFKKVIPLGVLSNFVDCYWFIKAKTKLEKAYQHFLHPNNGMGMLFNYGDALYFDDVKNSELYFLDGTITTTRTLSLGGDINAVGIRFKPAGAYAFFKTPLQELKNQTINSSEAGMAMTAALYDELACHNSINDKVKVIEDFLKRAIIQENKIARAVTQTGNIIQRSKGIIPIKKIIESIGTSQRNLERLFNKQLGMTPNEFIKNIRAEHAREKIKAGVLSYSEIAHELGYFDQAHFIRSFKSVVGITPGEYRKCYIYGIKAARICPNV